MFWVTKMKLSIGIHGGLPIVESAGDECLLGDEMASQNLWGVKILLAPVLLLDPSG